YKAAFEAAMKRDRARNDVNKPARVGGIMVGMDTRVAEEGHNPPDPPSLPTGGDLVDFIDQDSGTTEKKPRSQIIKLPDYIDAFDKVKAPPDLTTLEVKDIQLVFSSGRTFTVQVESIHFGPGQRAYIYGRKGGVVYPRDQAGKVELDTTNTPYI